MHKWKGWMNVTQQKVNTAGSSMGSTETIASGIWLAEECPCLLLFPFVLKRKRKVEESGIGEQKLFALIFLKLWMEWKKQPVYSGKCLLMYFLGGVIQDAVISWKSEQLLASGQWCWWHHKTFVMELITGICNSVASPLWIPYQWASSPIVFSLSDLLLDYEEAS